MSSRFRNEAKPFLHNEHTTENKHKRLRKGKAAVRSIHYSNSWTVPVFFTSNTYASILNTGGYYMEKEEYLCCTDLINKKMNIVNSIMQGF